MQTDDKKKKNTLLIGVGIASGVLLGAGLAALGFKISLKKFLKADEAFDLCRLNMWAKYPKCDIQVLDNGIAIWGTNAQNQHKFLMGWAANNKESFGRVADAIKEMTEVKA